MGTVAAVVRTGDHKALLSASLREPLLGWCPGTTSELREHEIMSVDGFMSSRRERLREAGSHCVLLSGPVLKGVDQMFDRTSSGHHDALTSKTTFNVKRSKGHLLC